MEYRAVTLNRALKSTLMSCCLALFPVNTIQAGSADDINLSFLTSHFWSYCEPEFAVDIYIYATVPDGFVVLDISDPTKPAVASHQVVRERIRSLHRCGDFLIMSLTYASTRIYDISDRLNPTYVTEYPNDFPCVGVIDSLGFFYEAHDHDWTKLYVTDLRTPTDFTSLGEHFIDGWCVVNDVHLSDTVLCVGLTYYWASGYWSGSDGRVQVLNVSDLSNPVLRSTHPPLGGPVIGPIWYASVGGLAGAGSRLYVTMDYNGRHVLETVNIADPANPVLVDEDTSITTLEITLRDSILFVSNPLRVYDVSHTGAPRLLQVYDSIPSGLLHGDLMIACDDAVETYDVSRPDHIQKIGHAAEPNLTPQSFHFKTGRVVYMYNRADTVYAAYDLTDIYHPILLGTLDFVPTGILVHDTICLHAGSDTSLQIYSYADPLHPTLLSRIDLGPTHPQFAIAERNDTVYVAGNWNGPGGTRVRLLRFDITDPAHPVTGGAGNAWVSPFLSSVTDLKLHGDRAYLVHRLGVEVISLTMIPVVAGRYTGPWDYPYYTQIHTWRGTALLRSQYGPPLEVLDIRSPEPTQVTTHDSLSHGLGCTRDSLVFFSRPSDRLQIYVLRDADLVLKGEAVSPTGWSGLKVDDSLLLTSGQALSIWQMEMMMPTDVIDVAPAGTVPKSFALLGNYPNPFNPATKIEYSVTSAAHVEIEVLNLLGQRVRTIVRGLHAPGTYQVVWDGTNSNGRPVSSGTYFYRLRSGTDVVSRKMLLVK